MSEDDPQWAAPGRPGASGEPPEEGGAVPPTGPGDPAYGPNGPAPAQWAPSAPVSSTPLYAEYRPGIVPLRPLLLGDILGGVTSAIRGNPAATLGLGLVTTLVFAVPSAFLGAWLATWATNEFADRLPSEFEASGTDAFGLFGSLASYLPKIASTFAVLLMTAFMAQVIGQGVIGRKTSLGRTWSETRGRLLTVIGSALLIGLLLVALTVFCLGAPFGLILSSSGDGSMATGFVALLVGVLIWVLLLIWVSIRLGFTASAIVLEQLGVIGGMRRSWHLTSGQPFWRILGIRLLVGIMTGIGAAILSLPITYGLSFALRGLADSGATIAAGTVFIAALATVVTGTLTTPFSAGASTLLYIDQRIRREALDVQLVRVAQSGA